MPPLAVVVPKHAMAPIVPDPARIHSFPTEAAFEAWMRQHHASEPELWLRVYKKGSGLPTVTYAEALDVVLCWGWIDGIRKSLDAQSFLQRYTPRRARSIWSQVNRDHIARLTAAGRDAARTGAGRCCEDRWALGCGVRPHPQRECRRAAR